MSTDIYDVIIIGGGMAAVNAAYPLVKAGKDVAMVDGGVESDASTNEWNDAFEDIRRKREDQYKLFLGNDLSAIPLSAKNHAMSMTTGSRGYVTKYVDDLLPLEVNHATIVQSLAKGGLGEAWGAVCEVFDDEELDTVGLSVAETKKSYQEVIDRIGISGKREGFTLQKPFVPDPHAKNILKAFQRNKNKLQKENITITQSALALLTKKHGKRSSTTYNDMDFWSNKGLSIYRPSNAIDELRSKKNYRYISGVVVSHIKEKKDVVEIIGNKLVTNEKIVINGKKVIVAAGSINTTRILLKSFSFYNKKVPFLYKQNILIPTLHLAKVNAQDAKKQISFCQVVITNNDKIEGLTKYYAQLYSYKSLLLHKLISYIPLPATETLTFLSLFTPHMMLVDVRFPNDMKSTAYVKLKKEGTRDYIKIYPAQPKNMEIAMYEEIQRVKKVLRTLKLIPLKTVFPEKGATAHYAGGIPFVNELTKKYPLTVTRNGMLNQGKRIYVADAACWLALPPKPPSLTIMAHANTVGKNVLRALT